MELSAENTAKDTANDVLSNNKIEEKQPSPQPQEPPKKSKKDDRAKKDERNVEQFVKSLNSLPVEEKFLQLCKKYTAMAEENRKLNLYIKQSEKRYAMTLKEKEQLQHEFNKTILVKSKLENLCRELQKQNKAVKEESLLRIREEEERRKETQAKFQNTLGEITTLLQQNNDKNAKLRDDNISMSEKFKSIVSQYQLREQQVEKMAKQMALEQQLADTKMQKANLEHQAEKGRLLADMETLKMEVAQNRAKVSELQSIEAALRSQLAVYTDKYDEFQSALTKSNQVFGGFKGEMEKMSKKILKLEKESLSWKSRWERAQAALVEQCGERCKADEMARRLQALCRTMQAERTLLHNTLKEHNIERPPLPVITAEPPAPSSNTKAADAKVEAMAANCVQLKQSLAHLQNQLNVLTTKTPAPETKQEPKKKSKSKKKKINQPNTEDKPEQNTEDKSGQNTEDKSGQNMEDKSGQNTEVSELQNGDVAVDSLAKSISNPNVKDKAENEVTEKTNAEAIVTENENIEVKLTDILDSVDVPEVTELTELLEASSDKLPEIDLNENDLGDESFTQGVNDEVSHMLEVKPISEIAS